MVFLQPFDTSEWGILIDKSSVKASWESSSGLTRSMASNDVSSGRNKLLISDFTRI